MKILICDTLNKKVLEELQSLGECIDISSSESKDQDLPLEINDAEIVVIRSSTQLTKEIIENGDHVICAVSGKKIQLEKLSYWNVELQEAYFSHIEASKKR